MIEKNPIPANEEQRLKKLASLNILDTSAEQSFDELTELAAYICGTPVSVISLIDRDRQWFKSRYNWDQEFTRRSISFCQYTIMFDDVFEIEDAADDDILSENPLVKDRPGIRYYAGMPLMSSDNFALGSICVLDFKPSRLNEFQKKALRILAHQVAALIEMRQLSREVKHELKDASSHFHRQQEIQDLVTEQIHQLSGNSAGTEELKKINRLSDLLLRFNRFGLRTRQEAAEPIDMRQTLQQLVRDQEAMERFPAPIKLAFEESIPTRVLADKAQLLEILELLLSKFLDTEVEEMRLLIESEWESREACSINFNLEYLAAKSGSEAEDEIRVRLIKLLIQPLHGSFTTSREGNTETQSLQLQFSMDRQ